MRLILASAGIALLASSGSAMAADCTKGLLWPYVRNPGDCLTDAEIQAGKTGVYNGPATGQVDVSTIKPPPQVSSTVVECSHSWYWPFGDGDCKQVPAATANNTTGPGATTGTPATPPAAQPAAPAPAVKPQAAAAPLAPPIVQPAQPQSVAKPQAAIAPPVVQVAQANTAECHKGILWPFVRDNGDCPTAAEAANGKTSATPVAQSSAATAAQTCTRSWLWPIVSDTCVTQTTNNVPAPISVAMSPQQVAPAAVASARPSSATTCTKGTFWPFIRETGDCPTAAQTASGYTPPVAVAASAPAAMPAPAPAPASPAAVMQPVAVASPPAAACGKGIFWPFIRESGDCATAAENGGGRSSVTEVAANEPAAMSVSAPPPASPTPVMQPIAVASPLAAGCSKGIFWPFIRESGDCATAAENGTGRPSATAVAANEPAAMPVSAPPPASPAPVMQAVATAGPPPAVTCTRGTFWPFIRESGDCPTAAEKANGATPSAPITASVPVATPAVQANTAAATTSADAAACTRSWLWPFVRESGDCATTAEKGGNSTSAVPISASGPAAGPVVVRETTPAPEQSAPAQTGGPAAANPASCHKGLFWPFVRETGDCPTDADRGLPHNPS